MRDQAVATGLRHTSLRYFNVVGSGADELYDTSPHNLFPIVFEQLLAGETPRINGDDYDTPDGTCVRDYVHVADLAISHVAAAQRLSAGEELLPVYNLGSGTGVVGRGDHERDPHGHRHRLHPDVGPRRAGDPARIVATGEAAARDLDWQMRHDLEDMVRSAWRTQQPLNDACHDRDMTSLTDLFSLDGKVAIVTGASSGLGVAFAQGFAEAGADVVLGARRADKLADTAALVEKAGRRAIAVATDVASPEDCQALVDSAMETFGRVDVLINNAGIGTAVPATRETPEQFRQVIDVNLNGCYWMAQACGRVMEPGSSIINISSVLGLTTAGLPQAAYAASKAGLIGLTRDLAQQWTGRKGIRVNAIAPGFFESEMTDQYPEGYLESQGPRIPVGRKGDPQELAATAVFLASPAAGYITGQTLPVDGGMTIT